MSNHLELRPTRIRYGVIAASTLMGILLYLDRFCIGIAEPFIRQDLGITKIQIGVLISAFFWPYALAQIPSGWLADRFGARKMMTIYILAWSFFTAMMGLATGFIMLVAMRAACGLSQSGAYPTSSSIVSRWIPVLGRGSASSFISLGGRIGGAIAPVLTAILIVAFASADKSPLLETKSVLDSAQILEKLGERNEKGNEAYLYLFNKSSGALKEIVSSPSTENTKPSQEIMVASFNQAIRDPGFYSADAFLRVKNMDLFTVKCIKRIERGETLNDADSEKFNRSLLESLFPIEIQGIYMTSWRPVLWLYGSLGLVVAGLFWLVVRDRPQLHPRCNQAEVALIIGEMDPDESKKIGSIPLGDIVSSPSLWFSGVSQFGVNIGWLFIPSWFLTYLMEQHQVPILERGTMGMIPFIVGFPGLLLGGIVTDKLVSLVGVRWARRLPWIISKSIAVGAFAVCPLLDSPWAVTAMMATVAFCVDFGNPASWAFTQDVGGKHVGSVLGFGNMWGNLGAAVSPILLAWIIQNHGYSPVFYTCATLFAVSTICSFFIDAATPVISEDKQ